MRFVFTSLRICLVALQNGTDCCCVAFATVFVRFDTSSWKMSKYKVCTRRCRKQLETIVHVHAARQYSSRRMAPFQKHTSTCCRSVKLQSDCNAEQNISQPASQPSRQPASQLREQGHSSACQPNKLSRQTCFCLDATGGDKQVAPLITDRLFLEPKDLSQASWTMCSSRNMKSLR